MVKIIGISGRKQSGKNTTANIISGSVLQNMQMIQEFGINDRGILEIKTTNKQGSVGWGEFDLLRTDDEFINYAEHYIWPYIKTYHFADYLKKICVDLFDLTPRQVYGTDADKNTDTPYGMTAREFLQHFGTNIMRQIKDTVWIDYTIKTILEENSEIALIPDVRFPNEVVAIKNAGGYVIRLVRDNSQSTHKTESALDEDNFNWDTFDHIIYNEQCSISELKNKVLEIQSLWSK